MSRNTRDCWKTQGPCFSSACPACTLATGHLTPGTGPVHGAWSYHDVPWGPTAKRWVLLRISRSRAPDPRGHIHRASMRDGGKSPREMPVPALALLLASSRSPEPTAEVLVRHWHEHQPVPSPNTVIFLTSSPPASWKEVTAIQQGSHTERSR